ncbi:FKBP12-interacting protein of 37 kDa [Linum perenne]
MASRNHLDDDDDFGGDFNGRRPGNKRGFGDIEDDDDDIFSSKKGISKVEETAVILSLRERCRFLQIILGLLYYSLDNCKNDLATCHTELEEAKLEIQKWLSAFEDSPFIPFGKSPEPKIVINYLQTLKASVEILKEQLEKAKKKEAAFIVTFAKREQEIAELKSAVRGLRAQLKPPSMQARRLLLDPAIHEEFTRLKNLVEEKDKKVKELQDNIAAVNFTPQSKMGKMLMAKCKTLQEENEEIGAQAAEGKIHELGMKLGLQKSQNAELRNQYEGVGKQCGLHKHMEGLTNDVEKANEMVLVLQGKVGDKDQEISELKQKLELRRQKAASEAKEAAEPPNHSTPENAVSDTALTTPKQEIETE